MSAGLSIAARIAIVATVSYMTKKDSTFSIIQFTV